MTTASIQSRRLTALDRRRRSALAATPRVDIPADTKSNPVAEQVWEQVAKRLARSSPVHVAAERGYLTCRGVSAGVVVVASARLARFYRRHEAEVAFLVREMSDFHGVLICDEAVPA